MLLVVGDVVLEEGPRAELMSVALEHGDFLRGRFYVIEVAKMVDQHSFFVNPSRNERNRPKADFTPTELMNTLMGHMIGGRGRTRVMGTSIKSRDSAIVRLDLSNTPSDEGRVVSLHLSSTLMERW